ncbi:hypothetical protein SSAG_01166 [Streptomyces sp. Mg1]|nr:hypothetical protein SSAG_01166 [Streptomyces sp. Mg1]
MPSQGPPFGQGGPALRSGLFGPRNGFRTSGVMRTKKEWLTRRPPPIMIQNAVFATDRGC